MKSLPLELKPFKSLINITYQPYIKIKAKKGNTTLFQSKFSGKPYMPLNEEYPTDADGVPMVLLAQLNFSELPKLENFPTKGILQIFISQLDDLYGCDLDNCTSQENYTIKYYPSIIKDETQLRTDFSDIIQKDVERYLPIESEDVKLTFELDKEPLSPCDYKFDNIFDGVIGYDVDEEVYEKYFDFSNSEGHKVGGYPYFTQADPRSDEDDCDILLLQIDTDQGIDCMWGDSGIANFFINKKDLLNLDFSRVMYNWDCC